MAVSQPGSDSPAESPTTALPRATVRPVFVDDSGRRRRLAVVTGCAVVVACLVYVAVAGISVLRDPQHRTLGQSLNGLLPDALAAEGGADPSTGVEEPAVLPEPAPVRTLVAPPKAARLTGAPVPTTAPAAPAAVPAPPPEHIATSADAAATTPRPRKTRSVTTGQTSRNPQPTPPAPGTGSPTAPGE